MSKSDNIPKIIREISLNHLRRIDISLEGNWNFNIVTIWTRENGFNGLSGIIRSHQTFKPSLELYFEGYWVGLNCFKIIDNNNVFNEELALKVIKYIDEYFTKE